MCLLYVVLPYFFNIYQASVACSHLFVFNPESVSAYITSVNKLPHHEIKQWTTTRETRLRKGINTRRQKGENKQKTTWWLSGCSSNKGGIGQVRSKPDNPDQIALFLFHLVMDNLDRYYRFGTRCTRFDDLTCERWQLWQVWWPSAWTEGSVFSTTQGHGGRDQWGNKKRDWPEIGIVWWECSSIYRGTLGDQKPPDGWF